MNRERVIFGFFIVLALTLNFGFVLGEIDNPNHHGVVELFLVIVVNLIATGLKLGDRSQIGAVLLATSFVADLQLIGAAIVWTVAVHVTGTGGHCLAGRWSAGCQRRLGQHAGCGNPDAAPLVDRNRP